MKRGPRRPPIIETCGAFFLCYRQPEKTRAVLEHFRRHYPTATVWLISDGGDDFSAMAEEFNCIYRYEHNIGYAIKVGEEKMHEWFRRLLYTCKGCTERWMIVLEDDVLTRKKMRDSQYAIAGIDSWRGKKAYRGAIADYIFGKHPHLVNNGYGGGGGTIFRRELAIQCIENYFANESFDHWRRMFPVGTASDLWLTTMFMVCGYQYGPYHDLVNIWKNRNWWRSRAAIVHQPPWRYLLGETAK